MVISEVEQEIILLLREIKPFEIIEIHKDKLGRPDFYLVKREQKIIFSG